MNNTVKALFQALALLTLTMALTFLLKLYPLRPTIVLTADNIINLNLPVVAQSVDRVIADYKRLRAKDKNKDLYLVIESGGGSVQEGMRLIKVLNKDPHLFTVTIFAASMASAIVEAIPTTRYMIPNAYYMFHRASGATTALDILPLERINAERLGLSLADYRMKVLREWHIIGLWNLYHNISDEVINLECDESLNNKSDKITIQHFLFGEVTFVTAKCPLVNQPLG